LALWLAALFVCAFLNYAEVAFSMIALSIVVMVFMLVSGRWS